MPFLRLVCSTLSLCLAPIAGQGAGLSLVQLRAGSVSNVSAPRPHIVFILADDLGWNGVGYNGKGSTGKVKTPTINQLSKDGVRLDAYYAAAYCAPSRFALLTGRAPWKSESGSANFRADIPTGTNPKYVMLPKALQAAGYSTHLVGKWHQGFHMEEYMPRKRGFDTFFGILEGCTHHFTQQIPHEGGLFDCSVQTQDGHNVPSFHGGRSVIDLTEDDSPYLNYSIDDHVYGDDLYRDRAVQLIKSHDRSRPFFLYLSLQAPHEPFEVPDAYAKKYHGMHDDEKIYWGMHSHVDSTVKAVYDALQDANMYWNTLIVFTSDNGANARVSESPYAANTPHRGFKGVLFEGALHVPCFVAGGFLPNKAKGRVLNGLASVEDWYATLAHLAGAHVHKEGPWAPDSINNWYYISGAKDQSARENVVHHFVGAEYPSRMSTIRYKNYKANTFGIATPGFWMSKQCTPTDPCVYDLDADPGETTDVSDQLEDMVKEYMIPHMDETWKDAYKQVYFSNGIPNKVHATQQKACKAYAEADGYLAPWATQKDETHFQHQLKVKPLIGFSEFSIFIEGNSSELPSEYIY